MQEQKPDGWTALGVGLAFLILALIWVLLMSDVATAAVLVQAI